jgi:dipeptidyl aminopeptidase/acylaminoacyl peptidase
MGEVYKARDLRVDRMVALKVLPEDFLEGHEKRARFEREARMLASVNHPAVAVLYSFEEIPGVSSTSPARPVLVMEFVEGRTLRELLAQAPLPPKQTLDLACQMASGLARAHGAGVVHRDLKPENVMVTGDGLVKILDFGLARRMPFEGGAGAAASTLTQEGSIVGTAGYMSPEQAAGRPLDFRTDQFSLGSILYELATGKPAFRRSSAVETLAAIINEEPEPLVTANPRVPAPLRWIIERCLAKDPSRRYASTEDLARELVAVRDHLSELPGHSAAWRAGAALRRFPVAATLATVVVLAALAAAYVLGRRAGERPQPDFQRLTFARGAVASARFAADGRTVVYGAAWEGAPIRLFSARTDGRDSRRLELADADVVGVSSRGEIAMLLGRPLASVNRWVGTLALAPLTGGAPREIAEAVADADWSPDGSGLAIVRQVGKSHRLEFPIGRVLYETKGWMEGIRFSPRGDRIALFVRDTDVSVEMVDLAGKHTVLSRGWKRSSGLAWSADGREIWFGANESGWRTPLFAVTTAGARRLVMRLPAYIRLEDISRDGQALMCLQALRWTTRGEAAGDSGERDLSWHEGSMVKSITPDGRTMLFDEGSEGYFHTVYVRPMDGSPAKRIGEGRAMAISPDGRWVAANVGGRGAETLLLPTGAGEPRDIGSEGHHFEEATFFPDGKRLLLLARDPGRGFGSYVKDLVDGTLRPVGPEGCSCRVLSPDGKEAACVSAAGDGMFVALEGAQSRPIPGFLARRDQPVQWSSDGHFLFVGPAVGPTVDSLGRDDTILRVYRLDLATGAREVWREFTPADRAALLFPLYNFAMTADGRSYAYSFMNAPSDLYLVTGLR